MGILSVMLTCWVVGYVVCQTDDSVLQLYPEFGQLLSRTTGVEHSLEDHESRIADNAGKITENQGRLTALEGFRKAYFFGFYDIGKASDITKGGKIGFTKKYADPGSNYANSRYTIPYSGVYVFSWTVSTYWGSCFSSKLYTGEYFPADATDYRTLNSETVVQYVSAGKATWVEQGNNDCRRLRRATLAIYRIY